MRKLAAILAIVGLSVISISNQAHAYGNYQMPDATAWSAPHWQSSLRYRPHTGYEPYRYRHHARAHRRPQQGHHGHGNLVASNGVSTSVNPVALPKFQCLIAGLEQVGYHIVTLGGYGQRPNPSAHPTGCALDVNQTARNRTLRPLPANATAIAHKCGLVHGAEWRNPDGGHFEMPQKYGYVFPSGRHYAAHWNHRRFAMNVRRRWHHWRPRYAGA
jgi:hypothetical protein